MMNGCRMLRILAVLACSGSYAAAPALGEPALRGYNAQIGETSVSGISSGAFMAVQFGTAWSSIVGGVGVVAGGPFWCAEADASDVLNGYQLPLLRATGPCMNGPASDLNIGDFVAKTDAKAAAAAIDSLDSLKRQKIYVFHGYNDAIVARAVTDAAVDFYRHYLGEASRGSLFYQTTIGAGHSFVVARASGAKACDANESPYIDQCGYDQAGIMLQHFYGALNPPNRGQLKGTLKRFDQSPYTKPDPPDALSLGDSGYVFVPQDCDGGAPCRVHIALHGCAQDVGDIGRQFVELAGYNAWADTNRLIVLYPQTRSEALLPYNPLACWDWWSYVDHTDGYITKSGAQIRAIKAMLDTLTSAGMPTTSQVLASPALAVIDTSDTAVDLALTPMGTPSVYRIRRAGADGQFAAVGETTGFSFVDTGLTPRSTYRWHVTIVVDGVEGQTSADVSATTSATPAPCGVPSSCPVTK